MSLSLQQLFEEFSHAYPRPADAPGTEAAPAPAAVGESPADNAAAASAPAPTGEAAAAASSAPAPPPAPVRQVDYAACGYHLDVAVAPDQVVAAAQRLDQNGFAIDAVTGVDWIAEQQMEVVYDFFHPESNLRVVVRSRVPRDTPEIPTISAVFPGANWHERETHDFFGIRFLGHPDLTPFLLPEDADYHPLKKDFTA